MRLLYFNKKQYFLVSMLIAVALLAFVSPAAALTGTPGNDSLVSTPADETIDGDAGTDTVEYDGDPHEYLFSLSGGNLVIADTIGGRDGTDTLINIEQLQFGAYTCNLVVGSNSSDSLTGTNGADCLIGLNNNDTLDGLSGDDVLIGGPGNDTLNGRNNNDTFVWHSGHGMDSYTGGNGTDTLHITADIPLSSFGGNSIENIVGDGHAVTGTNSRNTLDFSQTNVTGITRIDGLGDHDTITASKNQGAPVYGNSGNDKLYGTNGPDIIFGDGGNDIVEAKDGDDQITGGTGNDILKGQNNNDTFFWAAGDGTDTFLGGNGFDEIIVSGAGDLPLTGLATSNSINQITGDGTQSVVGTSGRNTIDLSVTDLVGIAAVKGLGDHDTLTASKNQGAPVEGDEGNDTINGSKGPDVLLGGPGNDTINANDGDDQIIGGPGTDTLRGQNNNDTFFWTAGDGIDTFLGGNGSDTIIVFGTLVQSGFDTSNSIETIDGDGNPIEGTSGRNTLNFSNTDLVDISAVNGLGDHDTITASKNQGAPIYGNQGNDTINGSKGNDILFGNEGNDTINANDGNDQITGGPGNDTLRGQNNNDTFFWVTGDGIDTFLGGNGSDAIMVTGLLVQSQFDTSNSIETIDGDGNPIHGTSGRNTLNFSNTDLVDISAVDGLGDHDTLTASKNQGAPIYGNSGNDTINGSKGPDILFGDAGNDTIEANDGDDQITGGPGNDTLRGQNNNDTFFWYDGDGIDDFRGGNGTDNIQIFGDIVFSSFDTTNSIESIVGNSTHDILGTSGRNTLNFSNTDLTNIDVIDGLNDHDTLTASKNQGAPVVGSNGNDDLIGSNGPDILLGNAGNDELDGRDGDDDLQGGDGNDDLFGRNNNDTLIGGKNNDFLNGGNGTDTAVFSGDASQYLFSVNNSGYLIVQDTIADRDGTDTLVDNIERIQISGTDCTLIYGNNGNNTLNGSANADCFFGLEGNDTLNGNDGNDLFVGGEGDDNLNGGAGTDTAVFSGDPTQYIFSQNGSGQLIVQDTVPNRDGTDTLDSIEVLEFNGFTCNNLILGTNGNDTLNGTNSSDCIFGFDGNDKIRGNSGNDHIWGGLGADEMRGGNNNDTFYWVPGDGIDALIKGEGNSDTLLLTGGAGDFVLPTFSTNNQLEKIESVGVSRNIVGDNSNNTMDFSNTNLINIVSISGLDGADTIKSAKNHSTPVFGGPGNDNIHGSNGANELHGGPDNDKIWGNSGNDLIWGDTGADEMRGGSNNDTFYWTAGDGIDTLIKGEGNFDQLILQDSGDPDPEIFILPSFSPSNQLERISSDSAHAIQGDNNNNNMDFSNTELVNIVSISGLDGADTIKSANNHSTPIFGGPGNDNIHGSNGANELHGGPDNDKIWGNSGNDQIWGDTGTDEMRGGSNNDTFYWAAGDGIDTLIKGEGNFDQLILKDSGDPDPEIFILPTFSPNNQLERISSESNHAIEGDNTNNNMDFSSTELINIVSISGLDGADTIKSANNHSTPIFGGPGNDNIHGSNGANELHGGPDNDKIWGNSGNDQIWGDTGADEMRGGNNNDTFYWTAGDGIDTLIKGEGNFDQLILEDTAADDPELFILPSFSPNNQLERIESTGTHKIEGDNTNNNMDFSDTELINIVSVDGLAGNDTLKSAKNHSTPIFGGPGNDNIHGSNGANELHGGPDNDKIWGNSGNDRIWGDTGADEMRGGNNNDTFYWVEGDGIDTLIKGEGNFDQLLLSGLNGDDFVLPTFSLNNQLERIEAVGITRNIVGNDNGNNLDFASTELVNINVIKGLDDNDTLKGYNTDDTFEGGKGNDLIDGRNGTDTAIFTGNSMQYTFSQSGSNLVVADKVADRDGTDTLINIEILIFDGVSCNLQVGTNSNNTLNGTNSPDCQFGLNGNDTLRGNDDNDLMQGGRGNDTIEGGNGFDTAVYNGSPTEYIFSQDGSGNLVIQDTVSNRDGTDTVKNVEKLQFADFACTNIILGTNGPDTLNGTNGADCIFGFAGDDIINGNNGNDHIWGNLGVDTINAGRNDDTLYWHVGDGIDNLNGGDQSDTLILTGSGDFVQTNFSPSNRIETIQSNGPTNIVGTAAADTLNFSNTNLFGIAKIDGLGAGDNITAAKNASAVLYGSEGDDTLNGSNQADEMYGGPGIDTMNGNNGNDLIVGGTENDILNGGRNDDTFRWSDGDGIDAFNGGDQNDTLELYGTDPFVLLNFAPSNRIETIRSMGAVRSIVGDGGANTLNFSNTNLFDIDAVFAGAGNDQLTAAKNASAILYGEGDNDTITGSSGADEMFGGLGVDTINGNNGNDTIIGGPDADNLNGGRNDDTFIWTDGDGIDTLNGGDQNDVLELFGTADYILLNFAPSNRIETIRSNDQVINIVADGNANILNFSNTNLIDIAAVFAGAGNDQLTAAKNASAILYGEGDNDTITGSNGNDEMHGGPGLDTINGNNGSDIIVGGPDNDTLNGGRNDDTFKWTDGDGEDTLNGGDQNDTLELDGSLDYLLTSFAPSNNIETINNIGSTPRNIVGDNNANVLNFSNTALINIDGVYGLGGEDIITAASNSAAILFGGDGNDTLNGGSGVDEMYGEGDDDTLNGQNGNDILDGGEGDDTLNGGRNNDSLDGGNGTDTCNGGDQTDTAVNCETEINIP